VYIRMPALPPQLQRQAELAAKHLRRMDWQRAALGASFASVAVLSVLLYNSYNTNRCVKSIERLFIATATRVVRLSQRYAV
jgi:hypothetical protein